eukprot:5326304-Prymnesium_polylepis.1
MSRSIAWTSRAPHRGALTTPTFVTCARRVARLGDLSADFSIDYAQVRLDFVSGPVAVKPVAT